MDQDPPHLQELRGPRIGRIGGVIGVISFDDRLDLFNAIARQRMGLEHLAEAAAFGLLHLQQNRQQFHHTPRVVAGRGEIGHANLVRLVLMRTAVAEAHHRADDLRGAARSPAVFATNTYFSIKTWEELRPHKTGIIRGIKFAEGGTKGMQRYLASDYAGLFKMLNKKRVDVAVSPSLNGRFQMVNLGIKGIVELKPAIDRFELFHYVHSKHAALAPKLAAIFRAMKTAGQLTAVRSHVIAKLLTPSNTTDAPCVWDYDCLEKGLDFLTPR